MDQQRVRIMLHAQAMIGVPGLMQGTHRPFCILVGDDVHARPRVAGRVRRSVDEDFFAPVSPVHRLLIIAADKVVAVSGSWSGACRSGVVALGEQLLLEGASFGVLAYKFVLLAPIDVW